MIEFKIAAPRIEMAPVEPQALPAICPPIARDYRNDHPIYEGPYDVEPGPLDIMLLTSGKLMTEPVLIHAVEQTGAVYETGTWTPSADIARGEIAFANAHDAAPVLIAMCDATNTNYSVDYSNFTLLIFDTYGLFGAKVPRTASGRRGMTVVYTYRSTSTTTSGSVMAEPGQTGASSPDYWVSAAKFYPSSNSDSRYWRSARTYKWIAIWKP